MTPRQLLFVFLALILPAIVPVSLVRAEDQSALGAATTPDEKPSKKKAAAKKKKTFDYDKSKYKSREISQTPTYKFNDKGEPITAETKKKAAVKKKKRSEPPEVGSPEGSEACGSEENCAEKKTEADAL
ncbi:MAG: hypothetical protein ABL955_04310 [Elusimicrobiota bacterium]